MNNLLNLELENNDAIILASPYQNINDRKEIYLKYLIISALKAHADIVDYQDSLFYSRKFYSLTRLFDFYVNNNLFDLIILKPDANEILFDIIQEEIHSNIYGYAVARVSSDFQNAELLGYFMAKDLKNVVNGKSINISELLPINNFEDIEITDSQISLDDVSDRFFELLSGFMDDELDEAGLAEFACLLYNSYQLREVFSEIGRFDSICVDLKDHENLINDEFLSVFDGEMEEKIIQQKEIEELENKKLINNDEYILDNLDDLAEDTPLALDTDEIDLSAELDILTEEEPQDLETLSDTKNNELEETTNLNELEKINLENHTEENDNETQNLEELTLDEDEPDLDLLISDETTIEENIENDELETEQDNNIETLDELLIDETTPIEELNESFDSSLDLDENSINELANIDIIPDNEKLLHFDQESEKNIDEELNLPEMPLTEEMDLILEEYEEEVIEQTESRPQSKLAQELAALSLKTKAEESNIEEIKEEKTETFEIIETIKEENDVEIIEFLPEINETQSNIDKNENFVEFVDEPQAQELEFENSQTEENQEESPKSNEILNDELLELLSDTSGIPIEVNDEELATILNEEDTNKSQEEIQQQIATNNNNATDVANNDISESNTKEDLSLLYSTNAPNENKTTIYDEELDEMLKLQAKAKEKANKNKKNLAIVAVVALLVVFGLSVVTSSSKNSKTTTKTYENKKDIVQKTETIKEAKNTQPKSIIEEDYEDDSDFLPPRNIVSTQETKIATSISNNTGSAPVILKSIAWQVPTSISSDTVFNKYLQIAGKNIKLNLSSDLLETDDFAYNNRVKVSMTVKNNTPVKNIKVLESSGSKNIDEIVLQSIKQTLKYINTPVMSEDTGDREVVLVISI